MWHCSCFVGLTDRLFHVQVSVFGNDLPNLAKNLQASLAKARNTGRTVDGGLVRCNPAAAPHGS